MKIILLLLLLFIVNINQASTKKPEDGSIKTEIENLKDVVEQRSGDYTKPATMNKEHQYKPEGFEIKIKDHKLGGLDLSSKFDCRTGKIDVSGGLNTYINKYLEMFSDGKMKTLYKNMTRQAKIELLINIIARLHITFMGSEGKWETFKKFWESSGFYSCLKKTYNEAFSGDVRGAVGKGDNQGNEFSLGINVIKLVGLQKCVTLHNPSENGYKKEDWIISHKWARHFVQKLLDAAFNLNAGVNWDIVSPECKEIQKYYEKGKKTYGITNPSLYDNPYLEAIIGSTKDNIQNIKKEYDFVSDVDAFDFNKYKLMKKGTLVGSSEKSIVDYKKTSVQTNSAKSATTQAKERAIKSIKNSIKTRIQVSFEKRTETKAASKTKMDNLELNQRELKSINKNFYQEELLEIGQLNNSNHQKIAFNLLRKVISIKKKSITEETNTVKEAMTQLFGNGCKESELINGMEKQLVDYKKLKKIIKDKNGEAKIEKAKEIKNENITIVEKYIKKIYDKAKERNQRELAIPLNHEMIRMQLAQSKIVNDTDLVLDVQSELESRKKIFLMFKNMTKINDYEGIQNKRDEAIFITEDDYRNNVDGKTLAFKEKNIAPKKVISINTGQEKDIQIRTLQYICSELLDLPIDNVTIPILSNGNNTVLNYTVLNQQIMNEREFMKILYKFEDPVLLFGLLGLDTNNQQLINIPVNKNGEAVADIRYNNNLYYIKRNIPGIKDFTTQDLIFAVNYIKKLKKNYYISIINVYDRLLTGVDEYFQNQINSHLMNGGHIFVKKMKIEKTIIILNIKKRLYILKLLLDKQNQKEEEF